MRDNEVAVLMSDHSSFSFMYERTYVSGLTYGRKMLYKMLASF